MKFIFNYYAVLRLGLISFHDNVETYFEPASSVPVYLLLED